MYTYVSAHHVVKLLLPYVMHMINFTRLPRFYACNIEKLRGAWVRGYKLIATCTYLHANRQSYKLRTTTQVTHSICTHFKIGRGLITTLNWVTSNKSDFSRCLRHYMYIDRYNAVYQKCCINKNLPYQDKRLCKYISLFRQNHKGSQQDLPH